MRKSAKILQTSTFRLVAIYLTFFVLSVALILAYVFWNTASLIERQADATIRAEVQALADQYSDFGLEGVRNTIERRSAERGSGVYALVSQDGHLIAGNLQATPDHDGEHGWIEFPVKVLDSGEAREQTARAFFTKLAGDYKLVVGRNVGEIRQFGDLIRRTLFSAVMIALLLGLTSGWMVSRNFLRRIDAITLASRGIMQGDLSQRMPSSGIDDELDRLAQSLNEMLDQIERLMAAMKEVTSNVAHDLKTPLTRLRARAEAALRSNGDEDCREALQQTITESENLLHTFDSLLSIARAEAGHSRDLMQILNARELIEGVCDLYQPIIEEDGGSLTVVTERGLMVRADRHLLAQALTNLIDNALKYGVADGQPAPEITIQGRRRGNKVIIIIADHGRGIASADRHRVLDRFVRLEASRSKPGNGLGLSLVAGIMKLHQGSITLKDNNPGLFVELALPAW